MKNIHRHLNNKNITYDYQIRTMPQKSDFFSHMHESYEFIYVFESSADLIVENKSFPLRANSLAIIRPNQYHSLKVGQESPYERIVLNTPVNEIDVALQPLNDVCITIDERSPIYRLFHYLKKMNEVFNDEEVLLYAQHIIPILLLACKTNADHTIPQESGILRNCLRFIEEHIEEPLTVPFIAKSCFVSSSYLSHLFQKELGIGVKQYVNNKKILYAKKLIDKGMTKTKAAERVGFDNYATFFRLYHKYIHDDNYTT